MDNIELQKYAERDIDILRILNINTTFRGYYLNNDEVKCKDALNTILSDTSSLNILNITNLMFIITATDNKEEIENISNILSKKLDTEPFYIEDLDYCCMLQVYHTYNSKDFIQKLPKDVISKISTNVKEREKTKIPKEKLDFYEENKDKDYDFILDPRIPIEKYNLSRDANSILVSLFLSYFVNSTQRAGLEKMLKDNNL